MKNTSTRHLKSADGQKVYTYYAFISYKHKDKRWAKWLQRRLEAYRLPNVLCRREDYPRHLTPIFRDETDLTAGKTVHELLLQNLAQCKYLIVICSRNMQEHPEYIDYEIRKFLELGNPAANILPLIVDGEANAADPANECLPPSLIEMGDARPLGVTLAAGRKRDAILKIIASMLGLEVQSLIRHDRDRRTRRIIAGLSCGIALTAGLGVFMAWQVLQVTQAQLREQNSYTAAALQSGDKLLAERMAEDTRNRINPLMESDVEREAETLHRLASIHPKYLPLTAVGAYNVNKQAMFTADGEYVLLWDENGVEKYDKRGESVLEFRASDVGHSVVAVSADGLRAVVLTLYAEGRDGATLWLWDMESRSMLAELVSSGKYDSADMRRGNLDATVAARFSPDGSVVCAYRAGGYFNVNDELAAWDSATGEKLFSLPGELLGTRDDGGQGATVSDFEFMTGRRLHWTGSAYHVYYDLDTEEAQTVPLRAAADMQDIGLTPAHGRYAVGSGEIGKLLCLDVFDYDGMIFELDPDEYVPDDGILHYGGRYTAIVRVRASGEKTLVTGLDVIDLNDFSAAVSTQDALRARESAYALYQVPGTDRAYALLTDSGVSLYRLDPENGRVSQIFLSDPALLTGEFGFIGACGDRDVLMLRSGDGTRIYEIYDGGYTAYTVDESFDTFSASAQLGSGEEPALLARHNGGCFLYPLANAGERLDAGVDYGEGEAACFAASADGSVVAKGFGKTLVAWRDGEEFLHAEYDYNVSSISISADGRTIAVSDSKYLRVYGEDGQLMASTGEFADGRACLARLAGIGDRVILLEQPDHYEIWGESYFILHIYETQSLTEVFVQPEYVYRIANADAANFLSVSEDGSMYAAIEMLPADAEADSYQRAVTIRSAADGHMLACTPVMLHPGSDVVELALEDNPDIAMTRSFSYVNFSGDRLLAGWSSGMWVIDPYELRALCFLPDAGELTGMPVMMENGLAVYPAGGAHIWDVAEGRLRNAVSVEIDDNSGRWQTNKTSAGEVFLSGDQRWLAISALNQTLLYRTDTWELAGTLAAQPVHVVFFDGSRLIYDTGDVLYDLELSEESAKQGAQ